MSSFPGAQGAPASAIAAPLHQLLTDSRVPGASIALIRDGEVTELTTAGVRNVSTGAAIDTDTIFEAASLSKPMFAYAVMQLVDAGALSLDIPLATHVPEYVLDDSRAAEITARHVLSHTSGLPNWRNSDTPLKTYFAPAIASATRAKASSGCSELPRP